MPYEKEAGQRQEIELPGGYNTDIEDEYRALQSLHSAVPDLVAEPISFHGNFYLVEEVNGDRIDTEKLEDPLQIAEDLKKLGETILENRQPHGDLRKSNILIQDGVTIIDPAGIHPGIESQNAEAYVDMAVTGDLEDLNSLIDEIAESSGIEQEEYRVDVPACSSVICF